MGEQGQIERVAEKVTEFTVSVDGVVPDDALDELAGLVTEWAVRYGIETPAITAFVTDRQD